MGQQFSSTMTQLLPAACVIDVTPPTFSGIQSLSALGNGALKAKWPAASDAATPIRYRVFIQKDTPVGLFNSSNIVYETRALEIQLFYNADGETLLENKEYFVGVRAVDAVNNQETNTVSLSAISSGVLNTTLSDFIKIVKAVMANQTCDLVSTIDTEELESELELTEVSSEVCAQHTTSNTEC